MSNSYLYPVPSVPTRDFLTALAATAQTFTQPFAGTPINNLPGLPPVGGRRYIIRAIAYLCVQDVGLEFDFFGSATGLTDAIATDTFISRYQFLKTNGVQYNAGALWRFYVDGLAIPYVDLDALASPITPPLLHVAVQNIDTVAKSAAAAGAIAATFYVEPMQAW